MSVKSLILFLLPCLLLLPAYSQNNAPLKFSEGLAAQRIILKDKQVAFGFVNQKGKVIIPHIYDTIYSGFTSGFASVGKNNRAGLIDKKGRMIVAFNYKEIGEITKTLIAVKDQRGLWGFCNHEGEPVIKPAYQNFHFASRGKIIVQKEGKWGIINEEGVTVLEHIYKMIKPYTEKNFHAWKVTTWTVKNIKNETIMTQQFDSLRYAGEKLYRFSLIGRKGLMDEKGKVVVAGEYEELNNFKYGLSKVRKDMYGVINPSGRVIIPMEYDDVLIDSLFIRVKKFERDGKNYKARWGLYDHKGNLLIRPKYSAMNAASEGMIAAMREDGTWGYISSMGATEIIFRYAAAEDFKNGHARVKVPYYTSKKDLFAIIDKKGEYIVGPADYNLYEMGLIKIERGNKTRQMIPAGKYSSVEKMNDRFYRVSKNGLYGMINSWGMEIISPIYDFVSPPSETGLIIVEKNGKSGVVDSRGQFTMKMNNRFEKIFGFREGYSKMQMKGKFGFIDKHGDIYISAQYPDAGEMSDSMVNVILRGKWGFVDYRENLKVQPYYEQVFPFRKGAAIVKENGLWNIVNKEGKQLHRNDVDTIQKTATGRYLLSLNGKWGMADESGREILAIKYDALEEIGNRMVMVRRNGLWGVLDYKENFILPIEHDVIIYEPANNTFIIGTYGKQEQIFIK